MTRPCEHYENVTCPVRVQVPDALVPREATFRFKFVVPIKNPDPDADVAPEETLHSFQTQLASAVVKSDWKLDVCDAREGNVAFMAL